jgi:hypothetical protein
MIRIHKNLKAKRSDYSLAVNPVTIAKTVLTAMKQADRTLSIESKPESKLATIIDPALIPTDETTFGEYFTVYDEKVVRGARRLVITVALNLTRRLDELKGDFASGLMTFLQENRTYINSTVLGYDKQAHIGHFFGLPRVTWRPQQEHLTTTIMAKTMTKDEVITFLQKEGIDKLPLDANGEESTVPRIVLEVDTPGEGIGDTRVVTTAIRIKVTHKYARLAMHQLTLATADETLNKEFDGADYLPPGMNEAIQDYRSFILGHNQMLDEHTVMRVNGLTVDALNKTFKRTDDGPEDLSLFEIFMEAGVKRIEETARTDSEGSWMFVLPKTKVPAVRRLVDFQIPKLYNQHIPQELKYRIPGIACPYRAHATYLNGGGGGSIASSVSGISNVSEGFMSMAQRYQQKAAHYINSSKSKSVTTPQRVGRPRNNNRYKQVSLVYGDLSTDFPALPSKRSKNMNGTTNDKTYAETAATATLTTTTANPVRDASTIATNPTVQSLSNEAFAEQLKESIRKDTQALITSSVQSSVTSAIVPVHQKIAQLESEMASLKQDMSNSLAQHFQAADLRFTMFATQLAAQLQTALPSAPVTQQQVVQEQQQALSAIELQQKQQQLRETQQEWSEPVSYAKRKSSPVAQEDAMMDCEQQETSAQRRARENNADNAGNSSTAS